MDVTGALVNFCEAHALGPIGTPALGPVGMVGGILTAVLLLVG